MPSGAGRAGALFMQLQVVRATAVCIKFYLSEVKGPIVHDGIGQIHGLTAARNCFPASH